MKLLLVIVFLLIVPFLHAQSDSIEFSKKEIKQQKKQTRNWSLKGYPLVFYSPETKLGFGLAGAFNFKAGPKSDTLLNDSQILTGSAYTLEKQLLLYLPWKIFWGENKNYSFGEVGYYKYFYQFHGVGQNSLIEDVDTFKVNFPRIRIHYSRKILEHFSLGAALWFEDYQIQTEIGSLVDATLGGKGGITHGVGPLFVFDSRNHVFYPEKGWYIEGKALTFQNFLGSDYNFTRGSLDIINYSTVHKNAVLASHLNYQFGSGSIPFNMMSALGGTKRMRGYYEGRYRDKNAIILQTEYRLALPKRFGLVAFADIGQVFSQFNDMKMKAWRWTAGGGIRFMLDVERKINIRLDYGFGKQTSGLYFTIGEAF